MQADAWAGPVDTPLLQLIRGATRSRRSRRSRIRRHQLSRPGVRLDLSCDIVDASHVPLPCSGLPAVSTSTSSSHLCGISGTMAGTMAAASAPHFTLFVGDVSLSAATKSFVKRLRRRRLSQFQSYCLSRSLSLFHLQFLSPPPPASSSTRRRL